MDATNSNFKIFWECPLCEISEYAFKQTYLKIDKKHNFYMFIETRCTILDYFLFTWIFCFATTVTTHIDTLRGHGWVHFTDVRQMYGYDVDLLLPWI